MENTTNENLEGGSPEDSANARVEETAQELSRQEDTLSADQSQEPVQSQANKKKDETNEDDDPGLVARMTAKGALSGF